MQVTEAVGVFGVGFGRHADQRRLIASLRQMAVDGVVAQVGLAAHEPARKRRLAVIADLVERSMPVDQRGLFGPEAIAVGQRALMEIRVARHVSSP